jgi:hypothetical protein
LSRVFTAVLPVLSADFVFGVAGLGVTRRRTRGKAHGMTIGVTNGSAQHAVEPRSTGRAASRIQGLDELVGGHPDALRALFAAGQATDPRDLGDEPRGRMLAVEKARDVNALARPLLRMISGPLPWRGKVFHADHTGVNVVLGRSVAAFRYENGTSDVDGAEALLLRYDAQPWPLRAIHDELRTVADGVAIGPIVLETGGARTVIGWFGLERAK